MRYVLTFAVILCVAVPVSAGPFTDFLRGLADVIEEAAFISRIRDAADFDHPVTKITARRMVEAEHSGPYSLAQVSLKIPKRRSRRLDKAHIPFYSECDAHHRGGCSDPQARRRQNPHHRRSEITLSRASRSYV